MEPQLGDRQLFPHLQPRVYCNHAAISPPSLPVQRAIEHAVQHYAQEGLGAFLFWQEQREVLRGKLSRLINAPSNSIALTSGTTRGLSDVALSIAWKPGDRVVVFEGEFPTNVTPWQCAARQFGLQLCWQKASDFNSSAGLQRLEEQLQSGSVRLVAVSAVQFQTGLQMPLTQIGRLCRTYGAELCVDAIQALGAVPVDVEASCIDYLSTGGHKWLMALEGCGFLYVRPEAQKALKPAVAGWLSHQHAEDFLRLGEGHLRYDRPLLEDARVFEGGARNALGFAALEASLDLIQSLTVARINRHIQAYHDALEPQLIARGLSSLRSSSAECRSGVLSFRVGDSGIDLLALHRHLWVSGISCATPDGALRFSPHWPNCLSEVAQIVQAVDAHLATAQAH